MRLLLLSNDFSSILRFVHTPDFLLRSLIGSIAATFALFSCCSCYMRSDLFGCRCTVVCRIPSRELWTLKTINKLHHSDKSSLNSCLNLPSAVLRDALQRWPVGHSMIPVHRPTFLQLLRIAWRTSAGGWSASTPFLQRNGDGLRSLYTRVNSPENRSRKTRLMASRMLGHSCK